MDGLSIGRIVHWVGGAPLTQYRGQHLAAVIVRSGPGQTVDLQVFCPDAGGLLFVGKVPYDANRHCGTWHYPES